MAAIEPIEGIEPRDLVAEASQGLIRERHSLAIEKVKQLLSRSYVLMEDVAKAKAELMKKEGKLKTTLERIEKLRAGDWSVLQDDKNEQPQQPKGE